ncbi:MAG TPA: family 20 glycosylhydrolase, partial [Niabella sp.]|nr:family 20 glycosylhydrolase [Niabella sp.]
GKEKRIAPVKDFEVLPFSRKEQVMRGKGEGYEPFSYERVYRENENLTDVPLHQLPPVIPTPYAYTRIDGTYPLGNSAVVIYNADLAFEATYLAEKTKELTGNGLVLKSKNKMDAAISLEIDEAVREGKPEAYTLAISKNGIHIKGTDAAGIFYGVQSLLSIFATAEKRDYKTWVPYIYIEDNPRFSFRSLHLDVARNFQNKKTVYRVLDIMAHYKLNNFLFYISEDEGWRVEIRGLPELTEIGSNRLHPANGKESKGVFSSYGSGPFALKETYGSGYYTRQDFIDILKYAKDRHIRVVPELNFPGHARAAIIAMENRYERLMKKGKKAAAEEYRLVDPLDRSEYLSPQLFKDNVVNISRESTYRFYEKIIDEFAAMYRDAGLKMDIIHAGGDEVAKGAWSQSPEVKKWALERGVKNEYTGLQAAFFKELVQRMEKKGLEVHGWEEVVIRHTEDGKFVPNPEFKNRKVVPYIWNNEYAYPDMGYQLANMGYDVVLCNVTNLYFDLAYSNDPKEPGLIWAGFVDTKKAWGFAPYHFQNTTLINRLGKEVYLDKAGAAFQPLNSEAKSRIRGVQAQMWSETIKGRDMLEYYLLPKLIGFSETSWARERDWEPVADRTIRLQKMDLSWNLFANAIAKAEFPKLAKWNNGYHFRIPPVGIKKENGMVRANVAFPGLEIRYTTNGSEPGPSSAVYKKPVKDKEGLRFKAFIK